MKTMWLMCGLILLLSGCARSGGPTSADVIPPVPQTPGAVITSDYICLPHREAGELHIWIDYMQRTCRRQR